MCSEGTGIYYGSLHKHDFISKLLKRFLYYKMTVNSTETGKITGEYCQDRTYYPIIPPVVVKTTGYGWGKGTTEWVLTRSLHFSMSNLKIYLYRIPRLLVFLHTSPSTFTKLYTPGSSIGYLLRRFIVRTFWHSFLKIKVSTVHFCLYKRTILIWAITL